MAQYAPRESTYIAKRHPRIDPAIGLSKMASALPKSSRPFLQISLRPIVFRVIHLRFTVRRITVRRILVVFRVIHFRQ